MFKKHRLTLKINIACHREKKHRETGKQYYYLETLDVLVSQAILIVL